MSIALATGDTISGVAGSATSITYTITGDEIAAGADAFGVLAQGQLPSSVGTLYTVPASTEAIVKGIHLANPTAGTVTASLAINGTADANVILPPISILAGGFAVLGDDGWHVYNDQGQALGVGATGAAGAAGADGADGAPGADGMSTAATPALTFDTTNAIGAAATAIRSDAQIALFDATDPAKVAATAAPGAAGTAARRDHAHDGLGEPLALTGATATTRYVGATATGAPASGTFAVGDYVIAQDGGIYVCTVAGSPGTWVAVSGGAAVVEVLDEGSSLTAALASLDFVGAGVTATTSGDDVTVTIPGGGAPTAAPYVTTAADAGLSAEVVIPGLAGSPDIPAGGGSDDEFDATDTSDPMTGWTTLGTPTAHDINSTVKSHYYVKLNATAGEHLTGIYKASPSTPFAMKAKLTAANIQANYNGAGIFIAEASPGKIDALNCSYNEGYKINLTQWSSPTGSAGSVANAVQPGGIMPVYFLIVAASSTDVSYYWSPDGILWRTVAVARNPGFTIGAVGLYVNPVNSTYHIEAAFDWVRFA